MSASGQPRFGGFTTFAVASIRGWWHHEGRRARHGLSKMAPDFVHWQGFYEVAKHFYAKFLPMVRELSPEVAKEILAQESHKWVEQGMKKEEIAKMLEFYQKEMEGKRL